MTSPRPWRSAFVASSLITSSASSPKRLRDAVREEVAQPVPSLDGAAPVARGSMAIA